MRKLVLTLIAVLLIVGTLFANFAIAEEVEQVDGVQNDEIYTFVEELCDRQGSDVPSVRSFLTDKFNALLGEDSVVEQKFSNGKYVNLVAQLTKQGATKQIIIGAHYDYAFVGAGAGDNACGVAALYFTMKQLASDPSKLPCNVIFVAFDGEEDGLLGSEHFVNRMTKDEVNNTLVMFNFDAIATGDNLYLLCENKSTDLAKLILNFADGAQEKPYAKGIYSNVFDSYGYGYYEFIQGSDHTPFRLQGIPIAFFFSGTYSSTFWQYEESADSLKQVMNTGRDTFANLKENSDFVNRIDTVSNAVVATVRSDDFMSVAENARSQLVNLKFWYKIWWPIIAVAVIAVVLVVLAIFHYRKLQKKAILNAPEIKSQTVFEKPSADDIFHFKSDDSDDIFTFKK